jgi:hypothetical protein
MVVPNSPLTSRMKRHMSSFSSTFIPPSAVEQQQLRLGGQRPGQPTRFCRP